MVESSSDNIKSFHVLAHNIRYLRKELKVSQEELANQLGIKRSNIAAYESKNVEPKLSIILSMAKLFDIQLQTFLEIKVTDSDYPRYSEDQSKQSTSNDINLHIDDTIEISEFIEKSNKIRKVLEGFKAFYSFKKENMKDDFPNKDKLLFDIDNFLQLMEHLLSYNETVIVAINRARQ